MGLHVEEEEDDDEDSSQDSSFCPSVMASNHQYSITKGKCQDGEVRTKSFNFGVDFLLNKTIGKGESQSTIEKILQ